MAQLRSILRAFAYPKLRLPGPGRVFCVLLFFVAPLRGIASELRSGFSEALPPGAVVAILAAGFAGIGLVGMYCCRYWGWRMVGVSLVAVAASQLPDLLSQPWSWRGLLAWAAVVACLLMGLEMWFLTGRPLACLNLAMSIIEGLNRQSPSERRLWELKQLPPEKALPGYLALLHSTDNDERFAAAIASSESGLKAAVPQLSNILLKSADADVAYYVLEGLRRLDSARIETGFREAMIAALRRGLLSREALHPNFVEAWLMLHRDCGSLESGAGELIRLGLIRQSDPKFVDLLKLLSRFRVSLPGLAPPDPGMFANRERMRRECAIMENIGLTEPVGMLEALKAKLALRIEGLTISPGKYFELELEITETMLHLHGLDSGGIWRSLLSKIHEGDITSLCREELNYYAVFNMQASLERGGWGGYFCNNGHEVDLAIRGAMEMGADHDAHQLREFKRRLDQDEEEGRERCISEIQDEVFATKHPPDQLHTYSMCHLYALKHLEIFGGKALAIPSS